MSYVEYPDRYEEAIRRRIKENARKGKRARWLAEDPTREQLVEQINSAYNGARCNPFIAKMAESLMEWGSLTAGQEAAVRRVLESDGAKKAQWAAERAERGAKSNHIGEVGKRQVFNLHVDTVLTFDSQFGDFYLHIMRQGDDIVIYKGSKELGAKGDDLIVKATVKEHGERDGARQTIITRPAVIVAEVPLAEPVEVKL